MNILVIGGAGYIGSHTVKSLKKEGYNVIIYDNLSKGHKEVSDILDVKLIIGDLGDKNKLKKVFEEEKIDVVMHFAAFIEVGESVIDPGKYYENNVGKVINLLNQMVESKVKYFVFSSTAATFGNPISLKIDEKHPKNPINPYGRSKLMVEEILSDFDLAYGLKSTILRYFNASGASVDGDLGESHNPETHLIPLVLFTAKGIRENIKIFGNDYETKDGTCIRDYIHVSDLANIHIKAMEKMIKDDKSVEYNLGSSNGYSVLEIIEKSKEITGEDIKSIITERRAGDPAVLVADNRKIKEELNIELEHDLDSIINTAWNWTKNRKF